MNPALVYRQHRRSFFWIALVSALAIHLGIVALAKTKSLTTSLADFSPPSDVELLETAEPEPPLLEESAVPAPLEQVSQDQDSFQEENVSPPPVRAHRATTRPASLVRRTTASLRSVKAMVAYAPRPVYPYDARRRRVTGSGVALVTVDETSGTVINVLMAQSCGNAILDDSTLDALRRWRFKPGRVVRVQVPIMYMLTGVSY
jgi:TonB family protein